MRRKEGKVPNNDSLVNLLLQVEPVAQKDSFQSWNREQQVSRVSHGETVGERLKSFSLKSAESLAESALASWQCEVGRSPSFWS